MAKKRPMMPNNMGNMMKQVQKMQAQMQKTQADIEAREFKSSVGGGAVNVTVNGKREMIALEIDKDVVDADDVEMLQDLILAAVNEAMRSAETAMTDEMGKLTGGLNVPGLF